VAPSPSNTVLVFLGRPAGTDIEVVYDELGLVPGTDRDSLVPPFERRKIGRFLDAAVEHGIVLDQRLNVRTSGGIEPLYFSASKSGKTVVVVASRSRFRPRQPLPTLSGRAARHTRTIQHAIRRLDVLSSAREHIKEKTRAKGSPQAKSLAAQLLRVVAHDLRNPLGGILSASQFLLEDAGPALDRHQATLLRSIESSSEHALQYVEDMLELHSIEAAKLVLRPQSTDVGEIAAECVATYAERARSRRVELEAKTVGAPVIVNLDRRRVMQATRALIRNELQCLEPGGRIEVTVSTRNDKVSIGVTTRGARPAAGGVKAILERMRATPSKGGLNEARTALTIAAVKRIVEAHGGSLQRENRGPGDVTFTILLPFTSGKERARAAGHRKE